jgi:hypothetical protein
LAWSEEGERIVSGSLGVEEREEMKKDLRDVADW